MTSNDQISVSAYSRPWVYKFRGWLMFLLGSALAIMTTIKPDVMILSQEYSWLPMIGILLMIAGFLRCLDGFTSLGSPSVLYNLQGGILDFIVGFLILFSVGHDPVSLGLLISGYLMTQGIIRIILFFVVPLQNPKSTWAGGLLSLILGYLVWMQWPFSAAWFLSLSLSIEIATRGWALIQLAKSLVKR